MPKIKPKPRKRIPSDQVHDHWSTAPLKGHACYIVGNGPSAADHDLSILEGCFTIGINRPWTLGIDPSICIFQDRDLLDRDEDRRQLEALTAIKLHCHDREDPPEWIRFRRKRNGFRQQPNEARPDPFVDIKMPQSTHELESMYTHGLAFQLAYLLGCNPIIFIGVDCRYRGGRTNCYGVNRAHHDQTLKYCWKTSEWIWNNRGDRTILNAGDCLALGERRYLPVDHRLRQRNLLRLLQID